MRSVDTQPIGRTCLSADGHEISYDVVGEGPSLLLLHGGFVHDRTMWYEAGYVAALSAEFRLILPDLRGHGASPHLTTPADYAIDRVLDDFERLDEVDRARALGQDPALSASEETFVARADLSVVRAAYTAFAGWTRIEPTDLTCPTAFIAGSENPWSMGSLRAHATAIAAAGVFTSILPGFSHDQELTEREAVLSIVRPFLEQNADRTSRAAR